MPSTITTFNGDVVCVLGAGGFVGARLCSRLVIAGAKEVRAIDVNFQPGGDEEKDTRIRHIRLDISDFKAVAAALEGAGTIFHLASAGMSGRGMLDKALCERVNVRGTENVVRACEEGHRQEAGVSDCLPCFFFHFTAFENVPSVLPRMWCGPHHAQPSIVRIKHRSSNSSAMTMSLHPHLHRNTLC